MNPTWFNRIEPGTFDRQQMGKQAGFPLSLSQAVVGLYPTTDVFAFVPGGIVPGDDCSIDSYSGDEHALTN